MVFETLSRFDFDCNLNLNLSYKITKLNLLVNSLIYTLFGVSRNNSTKFLLWSHEYFDKIIEIYLIFQSGFQTNFYENKKLLHFTYYFLATPKDYI